MDKDLEKYNDKKMISENSDEIKEKHPKTLNQSHPVEIGGPKGPEPTRYGDWEKKGRCIDF